MSKYEIGFIGSGKMASAIIKGLINTHFCEAEKIIASQAENDGIEQKEQELGIKVILDNKILVENSKTVFIATKPNQVANVLNEISSLINFEKLVVSIAAGVTTAKLEQSLPQNTRVVRVMPNTPALIGEGMSGILGGKNATKEDVQYIQNLLSSIGKCIVLDNEAQMDIVTAISGSGPAFFYKIINDIARAGEKLGLDYEKSLLLSIQTSIGAAKMALKRDISMENLIANVATKGGCTRVGVNTMELGQIDALLYDVIKNTTQKAHELGLS